MSGNAEAQRPVDRSKEVPGSPPVAAKCTLRWRAVLLVVLPVVLLAVVALALARTTDLDALWSDMTRPALVSGGGQVLFNGKPLAESQVMTQPVNGRGAPALGWTDKEGKFSLTTEIRGNVTEGATVGEHRVTVAARENVSMPGGPPLITPPKYASMESSPLRITIERDPHANQFKLLLEGEAPARANRPAGGGTMPAPRPPGGGGGRGGKKARSQEIQDAPELKNESPKVSTDPPEEK